MPRFQNPPSTHPSLFLPDGWDATWQKAKASSGSAPAIIHAIGDSVTTGLLASDVYLTSWWAKLRLNLISRYGRYADCWNTAWNTAQAGPTAGTHAFVTSGNGSNYLPHYCLQELWKSNDNTTASATLTPRDNSTAIDILYNDIVAGSFDYAVDGGAAVPVPGAGAGIMKKVAISGLSNAAHSVVCNTPSGNYGMTLCGFSAYSGSAGGIGFVWNAQSGQTSYPYTGAGNVSATDVLAGQNLNRTTLSTFPIGCHLAILAMGINDCAGSNIGPLSFRAVWAAVITALRRAQPHCSILLLIPCNPDPLYTDLPTGLYFANSAQWPLYIAAIYELAHTFGCAVANIHARWGETPSAQGFMSGNNPHPNDAGNADIATLLEGVI